MAGLAGILLERSVCPEIPRYEDSPLVELCGTGGDRAGLLNISTAAMFVVAGAGMRVVKHGNRAVSSRCGSADVLEALGVRLHLETGRVNEVLEQAGCVFLLASDYHRVVAFLAPLRRALAARDQATIFNLLGPLLNPVKPEYQLTGVYRREMLSQYAAAMGLLGRRKAWAVHGEGTGGGLDELTVTGCSHVVSAHEGKLDYFEIHPELIGLKRALTDAELKGGDALENAGRITEILSGDETGTARDMIVLNAAAALYVAGKGSSLPEAIALANESIDSGGAFASLKNLRRASQPRGV
jgi:anthranilate phosphoribosyltransferase